jgi:Icc-related predicted phosphoesterase
MLIVIFSSPRVTSVVESFDGVFMIIKIFIHLHEATSVFRVGKEIIVVIATVVIRAKRFGC